MCEIKYIPNPFWKNIILWFTRKNAISRCIPNALQIIAGVKILTFQISVQIFYLGYSANRNSS